MTRAGYLVLVGVLVVATGCAAHRPQQTIVTAPDDVVGAAAQGPAIVQLRGQHQTVTVTSGPDGPLYTAQTPDGRTIVANATLAQLRTEHPEVYQFIEPAMAMDASVEGAARPAKATTSGAVGGTSSDRFNRGPLMLDSNR
jgi:hypothetical protein